MPMAPRPHGINDERDASPRASSDIEAVVHNQDNREHDLLDSDDYYQFEGGMTAAVEAGLRHAARASITTTIRAPNAR